MTTTTTAPPHITRAIARLETAIADLLRGDRIDALDSIRLAEAAIRNAPGTTATATDSGAPVHEAGMFNIDVNLNGRGWRCAGNRSNRERAVVAASVWAASTRLPHRVVAPDGEVVWSSDAQGQERAP